MLDLLFAEGLKILIAPSQDEEANRVLSTRFHESEKTSRVCSRYCRIGNWSTEVSNSLMLPSPDAARSWLECDSEKQTSKSESWVSNL